MKLSKSGNTAYLEMSVWYNADKNEIHMTVPETGWFHTTVNNKPDGKRQHPNLFWKLARCLKEANALHPKAV